MHFCSKGYETNKNYLMRIEGKKLSAKFTYESFGEMKLTFCV